MSEGGIATKRYTEAQIEQNGNSTDTYVDYDRDFSSQLSDKIKKIIETKFTLIFKNAEKKYHSLNDKYKFDETGEYLNNIKSIISTGLDKAMMHSSKFENKPPKHNNK